MKKLIKRIIKKLVLPSIEKTIHHLQQSSAESNLRLDSLERSNLQLENFIISNSTYVSYTQDQLTNGPLVSIIMPTYNRAFIIKKAIESVITQNYKNWQLLIIDDGSTDNTYDVVKSYLFDDRIQYFSCARSGVCRSRNRGLCVASGEYIAYLDTDDSWKPYFLSKMVQTLEDNPYLSSAYCGYVSHFENGSAKINFESFDYSKLKNGNYIGLVTYVHTMECYLEFGGFDENLTRLVDWDLILKFAKHGEVGAVPILGVDYYDGSWGRISNIEELDSNFNKIKAKHA